MSQHKEIKELIMANQDFVTSLIEEIVRPGVQQLMETPYLSTEAARISRG